MATKTAITVSAAAAINRANSPSVNSPSDDRSDVWGGARTSAVKTSPLEQQGSFSDRAAVEGDLLNHAHGQTLQILAQRGVVDAGSIVLTRR